MIRKRKKNPRIATHIEYYRKKIKKESGKIKKEEVEEFNYLMKVTTQISNLNEKIENVTNSKRINKILNISLEKKCLPARYENQTGSSILSNFTSISFMSIDTHAHTQK